MDDPKSKNNDFFQVSVKGLFFKEGKLMMVQEEKGDWELPGGRIQKGEDLVEALKREVMEEMGLECEVLDDRPLFVYSTIDRENRSRFMVFYKIDLKSLDFKPSDECVAINFYTKDEIKGLNLLPQLKKLPEYL